MCFHMSYGQFMPERPHIFLMLSSSVIVFRECIPLDEEIHLPGIKFKWKPWDLDNGLKLRTFLPLKCLKLPPPLPPPPQKVIYSEGVYYCRLLRADILIHICLKIHVGPNVSYVYVANDWIKYCIIMWKFMLSCGQMFSYVIWSIYARKPHNFCFIFYRLVLSCFGNVSL